MLWWKNEDTKDCAGCIADGAVRSGKTFSMSLGYIFWSASCFDKQSFAICGKTITSVRRNLVKPLLDYLDAFDFIKVKDLPSKNYFDVTFGKNRNRYYLFGGKDSSSEGLIQGMTLAGILMDEIVLMPRSFVEQAVARCSVEGSRFWFNCNPGSQFHWFKKEWIDKAEEKNCCYFHFDLNDNPSLSQRIINRYHSLYSGAFYKRFVLGQWCSAEGLVYPRFDPERDSVDSLPRYFERFVISVDYGTVNPTSAGLWGKSGKVWYRTAEYYYDSRREGCSRTDEEHYDAVRELGLSCEKYGCKADSIVCDPSAASFMECIRRHGEFNVIGADNDVVSGIRRVSDALNTGEIAIYSGCKDILREFSLYRWNENSCYDAPIKEHDHAMDDMRYFVTAFLKEQTDCFCVFSLDRRGSRKGTDK